MKQSAAVVVIGAGPAGLTAAYELGKHGERPLVLEKAALVGGIARTECYRGYRIDIGGHRFYTKVAEAQRIWQELCGDALLRVRRQSRILYRGRFFTYPLQMFDALSKLGVLESARVVLDFLAMRARRRKRRAVSLEDWVVQRFGHRLYTTFFKTYTEKVWGMPCSTIRADWAAQRIGGLSLKAALMNAVFGTRGAKTLIEEFDYPELGPGQMWERAQAAVERAGGEVRLECEVVRLERDEGGVRGVAYRQGGEEHRVRADHVITSMPVSELMLRLDPPPPPEVLAAARGLRYRDFLIVGLVVNRARLFPDNWIYIHTPGLRVGRVQNFKNWSAAMVPDAARTSVGMEYFCSEGDDLWSMPDAELVALAGEELVRLGLARPGEVEDGVVIRQLKAYPVYDGDYQQHLEVIRRFLATVPNLQTVGRNGMHRYNNQDHSMLTGLLAVRNLFGEAHDLWRVNTERSYYEEQVVSPQAGDAAAPARRRAGLAATGPAVSLHGG